MNATDKNYVDRLHNQQVNELSELKNRLTILEGKPSPHPTDPHLPLRKILSPSRLDYPNRPALLSVFHYHLILPHDNYCVRIIEI